MVDGSTVGAGLESLDLLAQKGQPFVHARVATARLSCLLGQAHQLIFDTRQPRL